MAAMYDGWEYPPPHMYSAEHKDGEGYLRVRGKLLKKGGSRRGSAGGGGEVGGAPSGRPARTPSTVVASLFGRRNWSDRYFSLDIDAGVWSYFSDEALTKRAGVVRLVPGATRVIIPDEVRLRGRHAPSDASEALNYFEVHPTVDETGEERSAPFVARAPSEREFEEWIRSLRFALTHVADALRSPPKPPVDGHLMSPRDGDLARRFGGLAGLGSPVRVGFAFRRPSPPFFLHFLRA